MIALFTVCSDTIPNLGKVADSINLACAATAGTDLLLTGTKHLIGLDVPGIPFIADFRTISL